MKVALVYDRLNKWGGAERVLLTLHKLFPDAPLYTSIYDREGASWAKVFNVKTSFLQKFPFAIHHELYAPLMPMAFESFNFDGYDLVISVTSEAAKGIITKPETKHICYCLTPTRYLWSGYAEYFKNPILRLLSMPAIWYLKFWDKSAAQRPDTYIAISKEIQERIKKYYGRDSGIVYPSVVGPVGLRSRPISSLTMLHPNIRQRTSVRATRLGGYFLIVSRLVPYKKIDLAIRAFNKLKLTLIIIGNGSEMNRLKRIAGPSVEFMGNLTDKELVRYYSECRALVFPGLEDFGLTILEAQSFGKPVIAFKGGGALETIIEGKTGIFFNKQKIESLIEAVKRFDSLKFDSKDCVRQAEKFNFETFKQAILKQVEDAQMGIQSDNGEG